MPAGDGTGPLGQGAMTGRGLGRCGGSGSRFMSGRGFAGRGLGLGLGLGLGCLRYIANARRSGIDRRSTLEEQEAMLEEALSEVRRQKGSA